MHVVEGQGCPHMSMVGIHGCRWVWGTINGGWVSGRRQGRSRMIIFGRECTPEQSRNNQKARFGEEGQGRLVELRVLVWHVYRPKRPTETRQKRQEGETGKQQTKTTTAKNQRRTCKHTHINTWILHKNRVKEIKKKTGKKQNNRQALYQPTGKRKATEGEQTKRKMINQHSANQSKKM